VILALGSLLLLSACGGGGGGGSSSGGGGGGGGNVQVIATAGPPNVEPLVMDAGPANSLNTPFVTIKICAPGSTTACQTIDHIEVDTGSSGLRILSSVLTISLPAVMSGSNTLAECLQFADGSAFGPLASADLSLPTSGKSAAGLTVQVIGASGYTVPADCPGTPEDTVSTFGANGIIGVGPFMQDCGSACVTAPPIPGTYYTCTSGGTCTDANAALAAQVSNPVMFFSTDNNGVIVELPTPPSAGEASLGRAVLVFGIGTESNNGLGTATVLKADDATGFVNASFNGATDLNAALDSGSNLNFFSDSSLPQCTTAVGFYCPLSTVNLSATLTAFSGGATSTAAFTVVNAESAFSANPSAFVVPNLAGVLSVANSNSNTIQFDLGIPFFFGRNVFTAIENETAGGVAGPYFAY
jgi:hypothetical protein